MPVLTNEDVEEMLDEMSARQRVQYGVRWLTENWPGWRDRIDPETLDLRVSDSCICGQVFDHLADEEGTSLDGFEYADANLFSEANGWISQLIPKGEYVRCDLVSQLLGFNEGRGVGFDALQREWLKELGKEPGPIEDLYPDR